MGRDVGYSVTFTGLGEQGHLIGSVTTIEERRVCVCVSECVRERMCV